MHYFFLEEAVLISGTEVALADRDIKHAHRVLRLKAGDTVAIADGSGKARQGKVTLSSSREVTVMLGEERPAAESPIKITLFQSLVKGDKMDLIIRQAVELGVCKIVPFSSQRSIPRRGKDQDEKKLLRWESKVLAAAAQCRRAYLPSIEKAAEFSSLLPRIGGCRALVPWEEEKAVPLGEILKQPCPKEKAVFLFVGPEGGFAEHEIEALVEAGAESVHLGPRMLRSETAVAAVLTMVQAAWGDLSGEGECK